MIVNESTKYQGLRVGDTLKNANGQKWEILDVYGHNYLLKRNNQFAIALGYDSKDMEWAQGKYFTDEKSARKLWKDYSKGDAYGHDIGRGLNESADSSLYYDPDTKYNRDDIAAQISINYEGESNAITGYYKLIPFFKSVGDQEAIDHIKEIIGDEKSHQKILKELQFKYDGGIPTPED